MSRLIAAAVLVALVTAPAGANDALEEALARAREAEVQATIKAVLPTYAFIGAGGSGVVISPDGYVLTNDHVAGSAWVHRVRTMDGKLRFADLIGTDSHGDIALLKIRDAKGLAHATFGDSNALQQGQTVIAVGNPFGPGNVDEKPTVTCGVVSATHHYQKDYTDAIVTDAPINPGNSGGPLFTLAGTLVGINGQMRTRFRVRANSGLGYAIPMEQILLFLPRFKAADGGYVRHGGIPGMRISRSPRPPKVEVLRIDSVADKAGFKEGDVILTAGGRKISTASRFHGVIGIYPEGSTVTVTVLRGDKKLALRVTLAPADLGKPDLRVTLLGQEGDTALTVKRVDKDGIGAKAGILVGDRLLTLGGVELRTMPEDASLSNLLLQQTMRGGILLELSVLRKGKRVPLVLDLPRLAMKLGIETGDAFDAASWTSEMTLLDLVEGCGLQRAGLRPGDVLDTLDGHELDDDYATFRRVLRRLEPGQMVRLTYRRGQKDISTRVRVDLERKGQ